MKFWKILSILLEEIFPEWRDRFVSYKYLKKHLNLVYPKAEDVKPLPPKHSRLSHSEQEDEEEAEITKEVAEFLNLLKEEVEKFNDFFLQKEEDYVIAWKVIYIYIYKNTYNKFRNYLWFEGFSYFFYCSVLMNCMCYIF